MGMRRSRRGGHSGLEHGGSGEDSFVAVVVTKLTGALLFILLLTMVIMALIPKGTDAPPAGTAAAVAATPLAIATPEDWPEAIAGRPYHLALAATGGTAPLRWSVAGALPAGLTLDAETGLLHGTPTAGTATPAELVVRVRDAGARDDARNARLLIYQSDKPLTTPAWWKPALPPVPWRAWLEQGFGFLLLWLVYLVGMNALAGLQRWGLDAAEAGPDPEDDGGSRAAAGRRFALYRQTVRVATLASAAGLAAWLWRSRG